MIAKDALDCLKHAICIHVGIAGGLTADMAKISMKCIDILEMQDHDKASLEVYDVAFKLLESLTMNVISRLEPVIDTEHIKTMLFGCKTERDYLRTLACAFRELSTVTGETLEIKDRSGKIL